MECGVISSFIPPSDWEKSIPKPVSITEKHIGDTIDVSVAWSTPKPALIISVIAITTGVLSGTYFCLNPGPKLNLLSALWFVIFGTILKLGFGGNQKLTLTRDSIKTCHAIGPIRLMQRGLEINQESIVELVATNELNGTKMQKRRNLCPPAHQVKVSTSDASLTFGFHLPYGAKVRLMEIIRKHIITHAPPNHGSHQKTGG